MNIKYIFVIGLVFTLLVSCGKDKAKKHDINEYVRPASMVYSKQDTIDITNLVDQYIGYINAKNYEAAADMLYEFHTDSILPLNNEKRLRYLKLYNKLPNYGSRLKNIWLNSDRNNQVRYLLQVSKSGDLQKEVGVMILSLNPVLFDGKWYLTLLDSDAEGVEQKWLY